jgi:predicted Rossmann fold nucleotide-binding protein DprA/Smf involved in DNA uptake
MEAPCDGLPYLGFLVSRRASPLSILVAYDLARALRDAGVPVAGGFDAPVEHDCLDLLLRGQQPVLVVLARPLARFRPPASWATAMRDGRLHLTSPFAPEERGSPLANAWRRNQALADRCAGLLIVHAHPGGGVERLALSVLAQGQKPVFTPDIPANRALLAAGALPLPRNALPPGPWLVA